MDEEYAGDDAKSKRVVRLWRAWRTVHEMIADREYELAEDEVKISLDRFREEYCQPDGSINRAKLNFSARPSESMLAKNTPPATEANPNPTPDCGTVWVEFLNDASFGVTQIRAFARYIIANNYKTGIMVTHVALSPAARKSLASIEGLAKIECFLEDDLLVNITHHELVPRHVVLSRDEKSALLKRYRLKETQLPRILQKDPVARYLGLKRGQVVKIIRTSETAGRYASYRLCV
ncbi:DNA-directed RNA polymerases I, II, and III subunit RPABC1 [Geosmithia morbida]|uniref:DNA-directed RNA polymerases I, II, and III subunit RPABC1 n=1 Tax=Geosmithia morbida TaxID=1094350 RepID=A0A9P4Z386_9HYPO|nr:DNA-directed RNA polymerases I, II, and III subunit RPABC1 [Geosmithia morbida]KAF4126637.1 DNA-directed RNA polymerases I, II, and III subunit RPABC1 [Geosmithia morbida]